MIVKRFLCFLAAVFVLVAGCSVPVLAEESTVNSTYVPSVEARPVPSLPSGADAFSNHVIIYYSMVDEFQLFCSNYLPIPSTAPSDSSVLCQLSWSYDTTENYDVVCYKLDALNGADWVYSTSPRSVSRNNYSDSLSGSTFYKVNFGLKYWDYGAVDDTKGYVVYSDFAIISGDYSFFPNPSPVARTQAYLPLHTDLWQTIAAGVEKVVIASIAIVGTLVLVLLLRRLGKKIATF